MRRFWIRYTSQQRVRVIDCLQARTPPDALRLEVPALRHPPRIKTTVRVTYVPVLFHLPLHLPFPIHSPLPVISPERTHDFFIYRACSSNTVHPIPLQTAIRQFIILSIYVPAYSPHPVTDLGPDASLIFNWSAIASSLAAHPLTPAQYTASRFCLQPLRSQD